MPPRLLFVVNDAGFFLSHRLNIARAAREAGWEVHVATAPGPAVVRVEAEGFGHHALPLSRSGANPLAELRALWALFRLFRRLRPTLVHAVTIKPVLYSGLLAPWAGVPALVQAVSGLGHVFTAEGGLAALRRALVVAAYRVAFRHPRSRVIFQNPNDQEALRHALRPKKAVLIPGAGVDPDEFAPRPEPVGEPLVVLASRMLWAKGVGEFVEAAARLRSSVLLIISLSKRWSRHIIRSGHEGLRVRLVRLNNQSVFGETYERACHRRRRFHWLAHGGRAGSGRTLRHHPG